MNNFVTIEEAAKITGVSSATINKWLEQKKLKSKKLKKEKLVDLNDIFKLKNPKEINKKYVSLTEAAKLADVSTRTILRWIESTRLKATKPDESNMWVIATADLEEARDAKPSRQFKQIYSSVRLFRRSTEGYLFIYAKKSKNKVNEDAFCVVKDDVDLELREVLFDGLDTELEKIINSYRKGGDK